MFRRVCAVIMYEVSCIRATTTHCSSKLVCEKQSHTIMQLQLQSTHMPPKPVLGVGWMQLAHAAVPTDNFSQVFNFRSSLYILRRKISTGKISFPGSGEACSIFSFFIFLCFGFFSPRVIFGGKKINELEKSINFN